MSDEPIFTVNPDGRPVVILPNSTRSKAWGKSHFILQAKRNRAKTRAKSLLGGVAVENNRPSFLIPMTCDHHKSLRHSSLLVNTDIGALMGNWLFKARSQDSESESVEVEVVEDPEVMTNAEAALSLRTNLETVAKFIGDGSLTLTDSGLRRADVEALAAVRDRRSTEALDRAEALAAELGLD